MNRIIVIGRNDQLPRVINVVLGYAVDGTAFTAPLRIDPGQVVCPDCNGQGAIECSDINPSVRPWTERCERCRGDGVVEVEE